MSADLTRDPRRRGRHFYVAPLERLEGNAPPGGLIPAGARVPPGTPCGVCGRPARDRLHIKTPAPHPARPLGTRDPRSGALLTRDPPRDRTA